ncbi:MAG: aminopeptidase P family protein [Proteobacteria bacterium]|nr:aminopeptidase P family protein [Pseudomonadota bacterium]
MDKPKSPKAHNLGRLRRAMAEAGLDVVVALAPENVVYGAGAHFVMSDLYHLMEARDEYAACVVPADGEPTLLLWERERALAQRTSWLSEVRGYPPHGMVDLLAGVLAEKGLDRARIGVEKLYMPVGTFDSLAAALPGAEFAGADSALGTARMIKSAWEIETLGEVARLTAKAIHLGWERARAGDRERDVCADITANVMLFGAEPHVFSYGSGPNSALGHRWGDDRRLKPGDILHADAKGRLRGYWADVSRNAVVGKPNQRQADLYRRLVTVHDRIVERLRPGVLAGELYEFSLRALKEEGIEARPHLVAHGVGASLHEAPIIEPESAPIALEEGMVLTVEPGLREAGAFYHYEDMAVVTPAGGRLISSYGPDRDRLYVIA